MDHKLERERLEDQNHELAVELMRPRLRSQGSRQNIHNRPALLSAARRRWPSMSEGRVGQVVSIALLMHPVEDDRVPRGGQKRARSQRTRQGKPATALKLAPAPGGLLEQVKGRLYMQLRVDGRALEQALEILAHGLAGERHVISIAAKLGISRRELGRRMVRGDLAPPHNWLMAARVVWGVYLVAITGCTFRELARRTKVDQSGFSNLCRRATGQRPTALRDLCLEAGNITPIVDRMIAGYLLSTQDKQGRKTP